MANTVHELTKAGNLKRASYRQVAEWVKEAWENVDPELIKRSFQCCGISINTDGSEDDLLFDYDRVERFERREQRELTNNEITELDELDETTEIDEENEFYAEEEYTNHLVKPQEIEITNLEDIDSGEDDEDSFTDLK